MPQFEFSTSCPNTGAVTAVPSSIFTYSGASLPSVGTGYTVAELDLNTSAGDIDLTSWSHGADEGAWIRVRKTDSSTNRIMFDNYRFVNGVGEFLTFQVVNGALSIR